MPSTAFPAAVLAQPRRAVCRRAGAKNEIALASRGVRLANHSKNGASVIRTILMVSIAAALAVMTPTDSHADWQYTRWGMTPNQAIAASNGQLRRCDPQACKGKDATGDSNTVQLFGDYVSGQFNFTVFLYFDNRSSKLSYVTLQLKTPEKAIALLRALRKKYGEPSRRAREGEFVNIFKIFVWQDQNDWIQLMIIGDGPRADVSLSYGPRISDSNRGL